MDARVLLTGRPGSGKTTVVMKIVRELQQRDVLLTGFLTEEVRASGARIGFDLVGFDGSRETLARQGLETKPKVGRYGVDVAAVDAFSKRVVDGIRSLPKQGLVIIDEVGKMELFSHTFRDLVMQVVEANHPFLLTVTQAPLELPRELLARVDVEVHELTPENRQALPNQILARLAP